MTSSPAKSFLSALSFLTPLRVPEAWCGGEDGLRRAPAFFPVVGLLIGGFAAAVTFGVDYVLPALAVSVVAVLAMAAASRALHLDGLADAADGLLSSRPRDRVLEIMRDSHIGTMGVVAVVGVLLLKVALLSSLDGPERWRMVLLAAVGGRCAFLLIMSVFPYARKEGGLATVFQSGRGGAALRPAWALVVLLVCGWLVASYRGLVIGGACLGGALLVGWYVHHRIGGYTGDTLGATSELVELVPFLVAAIWTG